MPEDGQKTVRPAYTEMSESDAAWRPRVIVLLPCYNEAASIAQTIAGFRQVLPESDIVVCDNASTDGTAEIARAHGARVLTERRRGKGWAMRRLFADVDADLYLMADGDATYSPDDAPALLHALMQGGHDMVVGHRLKSAARDTFRPGHLFGNRLFAWLAKLIFQGAVGDLLSGYRAMTRRFVKTFPAESRGFEIETELTVFACEHHLSYAEIDVTYLSRGEGSESKLNTIRDGFVVGFMLLRLFRDMRPLHFFGGLAGLLVAISLVLFVPILETYLATSQVPRMPTLILIALLDLVALFMVTIGIILERTAAIRRYLQYLHYLSNPPPPAAEHDQRKFVTPVEPHSCR